MTKLVDQPRVVYKRLLGYVRPFWSIFVLAMVANVAFGLVDAGFVKLLQPLLDEGFVDRNQTFLRWIPFVIFGMFFLRGLASFISTYCMGWIGRKVVMVLRQEMFAKLLKLPAKFYDHMTSGELLAKVTYNVEQVAAASSDAVTTLVRDGFSAIGLIIVMLTINWRLTCIFLILIPLMSLLYLNASRRFRTTSQGIQDSVAVVTHTTQEVIEGYQEVKAFGGQVYERTRFNEATENNRAQEMRFIRTSAILMPLIQMLGAMGLAGVVYLATLPSGHFLSTATTPGGFAAIISSMIALLKPIRSLTKIGSAIQRGIAGAASIFELLDLPNEKDEGKKTLEQVQGRIVFDNVCFKYETSEQWVLKNISFAVEPGEIVAIVGRSGGGKSTLVKLLPRLYNIDSGQITLDEHLLDELSLENLRHHMSVVTQNVTLFNDTVANNIAYASPLATEQEIAEAAKQAYAHKFIESLPHGYQTLIGENGVRLSGGQRQRLAIARAILKKAPILILDEATSALDTESERHIQYALEKLMQNSTTLVIAHRLSTIENADKIIVIDAGMVKEYGSHASLIQQQGLYATLRQLQYDHDIRD